MAANAKIDSNVTGLRFAEEASFGVLPTSPAPTWYALEPNSYNDFGGEISTVARNPINAGRQRKKGVTTDLDASGGFEQDITQTNVQRLMQGFMFADLRKKAEKTVATLSGSPVAYQVTSGTDFKVGDLLFAKDFELTANNGLKKVTAAASGSVTASGLTADTGEAGTISRVGVEFGTGDATITNSGSAFPYMSTTTKDCTEIGLIPGEWVRIGGDAAGEKFAQTANNGWARVRSVTATRITFDKTENTMVTDTGTGKTIRLFCGRVLKNETGTSIVRRTYNLERTLGKADTADTYEQREYLEGAVPNEFTLDTKTADKLTAQFSFIAKTNSLYDGDTAPKAGTRPTLADADGFNTSSNVKRSRITVVSSTDAAPTALFGYLTDMSISLNNNLSPNKAVGYLGSFEVTAGTFEVSSSLTAYFSDVAAVTAVRNNSDVTLDMIFVKDNAGFTIDMPLGSLGDARVNVEQDQAITLPLSFDAATGAKISTDLDHTLMLVWYDYLPDAAE